MTGVLIFIHVSLACIAIGFGFFTLRDLLMRRLAVRCMNWFLRCSLGSSFAALFFPARHLLPAQRVAIVAVYAAGLVLLARHGFHLRGAWRDTFAFAIAFLVYLDVLALSLQVPGSGAVVWQLFQVLLFTATSVLGIVAARRFSMSSKTFLLIAQANQHPSAIRR